LIISKRRIKQELHGLDWHDCGEQHYNAVIITFMYENVDEPRLPFYDSILNNIKILKAENRTDLR